MATNNWDNINTDDYDLYSQGGDTVATTPGSPTIDEQGHLVLDPYYFPMSTLPQSTMDLDPNNTGPTNDFWTQFPITIDINGYIFYNNENTGINIRGPAGASTVHFDDLTPAQRESLKGADGADGANGRNGTDGIDGEDGLDAYHVWLRDNGYTEEAHPISEFYAYIGGLSNLLLKEGTGTGSLILNYKGDYNTAGGAGALATGYMTQANGNYSFTSGYYTKATENFQTVLGRYNLPNSNALFLVGKGSADNARSNALTLTTQGNLSVAGGIADGNGNVLSNKVDKISGKGLSTNDFTDVYKNFLDNYEVDTVLSTISTHPVQNKAIAEAIEQINISNGKPYQSQTTSDTYYGFLHPASIAAGPMTAALFSNRLQWNPNDFSLKVNSDNTVTNNYNFVFGSNLTADNDYQVTFGSFNDSNTGDLFNIGNGTSVNDLSNAFRVNVNGNIYAGGEVIDGSNNILSHKQDTLSFDTQPTQNSTNMVNSGNLYTYLVSHGINPSGGLNIPEIPLLQAALTALTTRVATLETTVAGLDNPREFIDDTYTYKTYLLGVDKDDLYIKLKETPESNNNEEEEEEENGNNGE